MGLAHRREIECELEDSLQMLFFGKTHELSYDIELVSFAGVLFVVCSTLHAKIDLNLNVFYPEYYI